MKTKKLAPIHPGEILREEFMKPRGLSQNALARTVSRPFGTYCASDGRFPTLKRWAIINHPSGMMNGES